MSHMSPIRHYGLQAAELALCLLVTAVKRLQLDWIATLTCNRDRQWLLDIYLLSLLIYTIYSWIDPTVDSMHGAIQLQSVWPGWEHSWMYITCKEMTHFRKS